MEPFEKILTEDRPQFKDTQDRTPNIGVRGSLIKLTIAEIKEVCKTLKNGQAPGPGNIPGELVKYGSEKLYHALRNLFQRCLNTSQVPECLTCQPYIKKETRAIATIIGV